MKRKVMIACLLMALISALIYVLLGTGVMEAGSVTSDEGVPPFYYIIPIFYIIMGILVFLKKRWLWIAITAINTFTIVVFYSMYATKPDIMLSAPGLITKIVQIIMDIGLIYLLVKSRRQEPA